jgi:hypothetical protein
MPRAQWVETYIRARERALVSRNVLSGWQSAGLVPLSPMTVLEELSTRSATTALPPHTPPQRTNIDLLLLPPGGIELREANALLEQAIKASKDITSPVKRCTERMSRAFEATHSENVTLRKQLKEAEALPSTCKILKKRVTGSHSMVGPCLARKKFSRWSGKRKRRWRRKRIASVHGSVK